MFSSVFFYFKLIKSCISLCISGGEYATTEIVLPLAAGDDDVEIAGDGGCAASLRWQDSWPWSISW